jgi:hypothetical protein
LELIARNSAKMSRRDLMRALGRAIKNRQELDDAMGVLEDAGHVQITKYVPVGGGTPTVLYRAGGTT